MTISLDHIGKRYNYEWVFRHLCCVFETATPAAVVGANGSGKSTLLQILSGSMLPTEGKLSYLDAENHPVYPEDFYRHISFTAPYLDLPDEFTPLESLKFISRFRKLWPNTSLAEMMEWVELPPTASRKPIRYLSSGMQQRVKLAHAFFVQSSVLLLDEPCTNLDKQGVQMYHRLVERFTENRILVIASNRPEEYDICTKILSIEAFKPSAPTHADWNGE
ncbi:ABC transporter ATP-binding protein [Thermoflavifilum thermophilum]|uniref:ABC-type multidrug transport system, ATPase component n=1 Tax=Thermoflavifilum thermophilum TaxID=1393122 RepID=A0A1I7N512_9BACT|nr:ATP-binding cassette domain-containing protein [Thermoflavifilum thermophilum]SFV29748.1 ABC-type multidrug transport system, ATPase component [Thermoflavifilum thermophilum]